MEIVQAIITQQEGTISCNFEQVEAVINERLKEYEGAIFTEDSKVMAKKELAGLRAEQKALSDNLKEAKRKFMEPWEKSEPQAKALIALYDKPITLINSQVKEFEEKRVAERKALIRSIYEELAEDVSDYIPLDRIYDKKWENATTKEKAIREGILSLAIGTRQAVATIQAMHSEAEEKALLVYRDTLNLSEAISCISQYEAQKVEILRREQERQHEAELARVRREEQEKLMAEQKAREALEAERRRAAEELEAQRRQAEEEKQAAVEQAKEEAAQEVIESLSPDTEEETTLYEYRVALSEEGKKQFEMYLDSVGIDWEMI